MRKVAVVLLLFFVLVSSPAYAGYLSESYSYSSDFKYLEPAKNLLYAAVVKVKNNREFDRTFITNIGIVNLSTNATTYIFKNDFRERVINLYFETGINSRGIVEFNIDNIARNNEGIQDRQVKDQLCIFTYEKEKKVYSLWFCNKMGQNLKRVKSFNEDTDWWIDVKNDKIYFIRQIAEKIDVQSIEW